MSIEKYNKSENSEKIYHEAKADFSGKVISYNDIHVMQYDKSLPVVMVYLYKNGKPYEISDEKLATTSMFVRFGERRDFECVYKPILGRDVDLLNVVYFDIDQNMSYFEGKYNPILELIINGEVAGSTSIRITVEKNPVPADFIESHIELPLAPVALTGDYNDLKNKPTDPIDPTTSSSAVVFESDHVALLSEVEDFNVKDDEYAFLPLNNIYHFEQSLEMATGHGEYGYILAYEKDPGDFYKHTLFKIYYCDGATIKMSKVNINDIPNFHNDFIIIHNISKILRYTAPWNYTSYFSGFNTFEVLNFSSNQFAEYNKLTAGTGITIENNVISASGGGGSKLYRHSIYFQVRQNNFSSWAAVIINDIPTAFTRQTLGAWLYDNNYYQSTGSSIVRIYPATGWYYGKLIGGIRANASKTLGVVHSADPSTSPEPTFSIISDNIYDIVREL